MGSGTFYEVGDDARLVLGECQSKAEWYEALGKLDIGDCPQLDAEDSIRFWASMLHEMSHPAEMFFEGELHAAYDEFDDPNVAFAGNHLARSFLTQLEQLGKEFFLERFPRNSPFGEGHSWLYEPLRDFLVPLCDRGNGVVILWEN